MFQGTNNLENECSWYPRKKLWGLLVRDFLQVICPSCHRTNGIRTVEDIKERLIKGIKGKVLPQTGLECWSLFVHPKEHWAEVDCVGARPDLYDKLLLWPLQHLSGGFNYDSTSIWLRFDCRLIPIRLQFDRATTIRRPTLRPRCCTAT